MNAKDRLCVALDVPSLGLAEQIVSGIVEYVGLFKVGMQLFTAEGPRAVKTVQGLGGRVFLDLKYNDIPNTVAGAARAAAELGLELFTIHANGGSAMMEAVATAVRDAQIEEEARPKVLAITVLTSLTTSVLKSELHVSMPMERMVVAMAKLAKKSAVDGVVASPKEIQSIRRACGNDFVILTPGIRPDWAAEPGDQRRITTPREAVEAGADYIVVGRPILNAPDRAGACQKILAEITLASER